MSQKWVSNAGPRQTKEVNEAIREHNWRGKTRLEITDHGRHEIVGMCAEPSPESQASAEAIGERFGWTITRENFREVIAAYQAATAAIVLPVDDLRTTEAERAQREIDRAERERTREKEATIKAEAVAVAVAALRERCPWAIAADEKMSEHARAAKNLRKELSIAFPGVKFSVTSESFSMGNSVDAHWADGPTSAEVEKISSKYQEGSFDGMDDSYNYDRSVDGEAVDIVLGRAKYCHTSRSVSSEFQAIVEEALCVAQKVAYVGQYTRGLFGENDPENVSYYARRLLYASSIPLGAVVTGVEQSPAGCEPSPYRLTFSIPATFIPATTPQTSESAGATIEKHHHTKKSFDMWLVIPAKRMEREVFESFRKLCEACGGWYSRQWGKTPGGFAFKSEKEATEFAIAFGSPSVTDTPTASPATTSAARPSIAEKLRTLADSMESTISDKLREMTQNWTPKRGVEYAARRHEGSNMQTAQHALRLLADAHEAGTCPPILADIATKKAVVDLTRTRVDTSGGYYSYSDTGELSDKSPKAAALRQFIESGKSAEDLEKEAEKKEAALIEAKIDALRGVKIDGFFPTPSAVVAEMIEAAEIEDGHTVLEPSAGIGSIADAVADAADVDLHCVELRHSLCEILKLKGHDVESADFLEMQPERQFDRVLMNPPFERAQDVAHVRHAFGMLKPGGRLVAIMADSAAFRNGFSTWLESLGGESKPLTGAFDTIDAFRRTGVNVRIVTIEKPSELATA